MIRALIVDDEPLAREAIRDLLAADGAFEVAGECASGEEAVEAIDKLHPDVVFLDVQMPRMGGFGVVEAVGADRMPLTVFATAYDQYALKAFEAQALDYVLKPFDEERFRRVLDRVRRQLARVAEPEAAGRLAIKSGGRTVFLRREEIRCFEASGNHVKVRTADASYLLRETIKSLETRLDADRFVRIHRSTIVNVEHVREIRPWYTGEYIVVMTGGRELTLSRGYRANLPRLQAR
jgi:two-component system LytT family response regulator